MKARLIACGGKIHIEVEESTVKDLFRKMEEASEIFSTESCCGCCNSENIAPCVRTHDGNDYFEFKCHGCGATFSIGQRKVGGGLFPKYKDKDGNYLPNRGWAKWSRHDSEA